jgi:hypothetical protein
MMMPVNADWAIALAVPYVMVAQALSGIAKDLTKMSSKSAIRLVIPQSAQSALFKWVAVLTGSKNALKGVGFFVGSVLLAQRRLPCRLGDDGGGVGVDFAVEPRAAVGPGQNQGQGQISPPVF